MSLFLAGSYDEVVVKQLVGTISVNIFYASCKYIFPVLKKMSLENSQMDLTFV